jgi:hypothetical protein
MQNTRKKKDKSNNARSIKPEGARKVRNARQKPDKNQTKCKLNQAHPTHREFSAQAGYPSA